MTRLLRRLRCHGTLLCCQYTDRPMCNSPYDPHLLGRLRWWRHARRQIREEQR